MTEPTLSELNFKALEGLFKRVNILETKTTENTIYLKVYGVLFLPVIGAAIKTLFFAS